MLNWWREWRLYCKLKKTKCYFITIPNGVKSVALEEANSIRADIFSEWAMKEEDGVFFTEKEKE